jgi:hypothetical protein
MRDELVDWAGVEERLVLGGEAAPHREVPAGYLALVTYAPRAAGLDERTCVWRGGEVVPETLAGGMWTFARGTMLQAA